MAGWISSKLKAAETLLHQIDQQAAESLGKSSSASDLTALQQPSSSALLDAPAPRRPPPATPPPSLGLRIAARRHSQPPAPPPSAPRRSASAAADLSAQDQPGAEPAVAVEAKAEGDRRDREEAEKGGPSESGSGSGSGSDDDSDGSGSDDSEEERRREEERSRRRAERLAAMAARAIAEREEAVARLEGEKTSLEKLLAVREKEQAQEASELQTSMIETMEATEIEKQRHHSTRMEALVRLAELEVTNAELAKSLAREQWNLEVQVDQVAHLREEVDLKTFAQDKYKRKIAKIQKTSAPLVDEIESLRRLKLEDEIIDAEYTQTCDRIVSLKDKARKIEENIELTRRDMVQPTEVEIELKKRLDQLTDRLIQKQMQVESLSSEKSTLVLRMEAVSRSLDTNASSLASSSSSSRIDIEAGTWQESYPPYSSPRLRDRIRTGQQHLGYAIRQLDSIFSAGHIFLRRNPKAQVGAAVYLVCLHIWVMYILSSHPAVPDTRPGATFSLELINKTSI
ncbi:golgin candidate 2 [Aegilops tauschii subsp. strangulata]|uniref:Golgin candidate 2 n=1 Tax=Aegilops tauschii subsp. strangulata TaxID=200361 RepID=A0A453D783_AEGTS|nr:golgin candidate 2 [Aegilops tauschii subsp. strangulata]